MKFLLKIPELIIEGFKLLPVKLRWPVACAFIAAGFYFAIIRSGTYAADLHHGEVSDIIVGILLFGIGLDAFIYAHNEEKQYESEDKAKLQG